MSAAAVILSVRCHTCSRRTSPVDIFSHTGGFKQCLRCYSHHLDCLKSFGTAQPPRECGSCLSSFEELAARAPGNGVRGTVQLKDGIYQFLCDRCSGEYVRKRADLYGDTAFGWRNKLKGAK